MLEVDKALKTMLSEAQNTTTGRIWKASSMDDAFNRCMKECVKPENCNGIVKYTVSEYGDMVFKSECPVYKAYKQKLHREERCEKILDMDHSFKNFDRAKNVKAFDIAKKYVEHRAWKQGGWLILYGGYGTGKTHLLVAVIREAIMQGVYASFVNLAKISTKEFETAKSELNRLTDYDLIGIDDFGIEASQNWLIPHVFKLFDDLNEKKRGLVMTTNMSLKGLQEILGERISDRIMERAVAVELTGESMRKALRKDNVSWAEEK